MNQSDVTTWLLDELETILDTTSLVSLPNPTSHVDVADSHDDQTYPFVGVQFISGDSESGGIGRGNLVVDNVNYDDSGLVQSIVRRKDITLRIEVVPVTDDDPALRDDLGDAITDHFSLVNEKGTHPDDIDEIRPEESSSAGRPSEFVRGQGLPLEIEYSRYLVDENVTGVESVNLDVSVGDTDNVVDEDDDPTAISDTV